MKRLTSAGLLTAGLLCGGFAHAGISDAEVSAKANQIQTQCRNDMSAASAPINEKYRKEVAAIGRSPMEEQALKGTPVSPQEKEELKKRTQDYLAKVKAIDERKKAELKTANDAHAACLKKQEQVWKLMDQKAEERTWPQGL